ncbi:MAG: DJ-1/PfpI family protein [Treponema sp.]|nr:DJ-1/PfpI family protein [Candidatus Treponema merdequi]
MKAVVILAPGFEEIEALTPVDYLRRAGVEVVTAGIAEKGGSFDKVIEGAHGIKVLCDMSFEEFLQNQKNELCDAVIIPGGMPGAANISADDKVIEYIIKMAEAKKYVCAICASPIVVLAKTGLLKDHNFTCYPGMEQKISDFISDSEKIDELMDGAYLSHMKSFIIDDKIITGKGPGAAEEFAMAIVKELCGVDTMMRVRTSSCQR